MQTSTLDSVLLPVTRDESLPTVAIVIGDRIESLSSDAPGLLGRDASEILGQPLCDFAPLKQAVGQPSCEILERRAQAARAGLPQSFEWQLQRPSGEIVDTLMTLEVAPGDQTGRLTGHLRDITFLRRAERERRESDTRLQQILNNTTAVVYVKDRDSRILFVNRRFVEMFHGEEQNFVGRKDSEVFPKDISDAYRVNDLRVLQEQIPMQFEEQALLDDGLHTYVSVKFPLYNTDGEAYAVCGISTDITERKRTEDALRNVAMGISGIMGGRFFQELTRSVAETLAVDFCLVAQLAKNAPDRAVTLAAYDSGNFIPKFEYDLAGSPCQHVIGQSFEYIPAGVRKLYPSDTLLQKSGFESYAAFPLFAANGGALGLIAVCHRQPMVDRDVTESILKIYSVRAAAELERQHSERALRASEEQYRSIFNAVADGLILWNQEGLVVDANPAFLRMHGYRSEELLGAKPTQFISHDCQEQFTFLLETVSEGKPVFVETATRRKDGSCFDVEIQGVQVHYQGQPHLLAMVRDISARRASEEEHARLEEQLRQAQKMEALGHLTGGIAHDFNNILTGVIGFTRLARDRLDPTQNAKIIGYLERADQSGQRARDLIKQMLTFSRGDRGEPKALFLPPLIKETIKLLRSTVPSTIEFRCELDENTPSVLVDPVHIEQILMNLCINARDAMEGNGQIAVSLRSSTFHRSVCASCRQSLQGDFVELSIADNGPGIDRDVVDRIFEPFFTTKEIGEGTGMGLSTVHGIIHEYGGHILLDTSPGRGAAFRVVFEPLTDDQSMESTDNWRAELATEPTRDLRGHVLIVDDEHMVGDFMGELLESWGLTVTVVNDSRAAKHLFLESPERFDAAVLDQTMPRMTGLELSQDLLRAKPTLPIILYTGYTEGILEGQLVNTGVRALMRKPIDPSRLFSLLEDFISNPAE